MISNKQTIRSKMKRYKSCLVFLAVLTLVYGRRERNPCADEMIPCDNGECIERHRWCNLPSDCSDHSDEMYCERRFFDEDVVNNNCTVKHFICDDAMCIPVSLRCDGERDCFDSSDEKNCETIEREESTQLYTTSPPRIETTTIPTTTDFYDKRRIDESFNRRDYNYYSSPSFAPPSHGAFPPAHRDTNYGNSYNSGSNTFPGGNFPDNRQTTVPPYAPEPTTQRRQYSRATARPQTRRGQSRSGYRHIPRENVMIFPPRSIAYVPSRSRSAGYPRSDVRAPNYFPFYFAKNYTADGQYNYKTNIRYAKEWLRSQRDSFYGWGRDTTRALIALSLISNSFQSDVEDNELLRKSLQTHLGVKILRNDTDIEQMSTTRLAMYINALLATCQDPRDFLGLDLGLILFYRQSHLEQEQRFVNPLIYLTLCLIDMPLNEEYVESFLTTSLQTEISKDLHILATTAMACIAQKRPHDRALISRLDEAVRNLLNQMNSADGTFGSKYSTALAAQALMSVNSSRYWDQRKTLDYLAQQQQEDGSFGDMQSTYYSLIALSGRSLLYLRNTRCDSPADVSEAVAKCSPNEIMNREGPRIAILYTLRVDYPETFSAGLRLSVPVNTNFYEIMCVAADHDPRFNFSHKITDNLLGVHTIANLPNDPERGKFWNLYWLPLSADTVDLTRRVTKDIRRVIPVEGDELLYWYLNDSDIQ